MKLNRSRKSITVLIADDDAEDRSQMIEAWRESHFANDIRTVEDGEDLMAYLERKGKYEDPALSPRPGLILLDLNMPRLDGREALRAIKANAHLKDIPVVVLTTSSAEEDIYRSYRLGVNSFISKPVTFGSLLELTQELGHYWFEIVELPESHEEL